MKFRYGLWGSLSAGICLNLMAAASLPSWVSPTSTFTWNTKLGGGIWYQPSNALSALAPEFIFFPRPVLVGLRSDVKENGYRFDLDQFTVPQPNEIGGGGSPYYYWTQRCS